MPTRIGKDVLESLTQAMYEDSRIIYREYIQNCADQIDKALAIGIIKNVKEAVINIIIDKKERKVVIEDNATGIKYEEIEPTLKNIAKSTKNRAKDKGFRGIGRLGGLAYCDELIFETSYPGEPVGTKMTWNAARHRQIINNRETFEDAAEVIDLITNIEHYDEDCSSHYFKVHLYNVSDDILLDNSNILNYLSQVAPVPYKKNQFKFVNRIFNYAQSKNCHIDEYQIYINSNLIEKEYTNYIYRGEEGKKTRFDEILDIDFFDIITPDLNLLAWGWYSISSFQGVLDEVNTARGIRLRKGNIQIGLENCLEKLHKEKRGNSYFFGEIHAVNPELIPNSRRDYFIENAITGQFDKLVEDFFAAKLYKFYHLASDVRSQFKVIRKVIEIKGEIETKEKKGYKTPGERDELIEKFTEAKKKAIKSESKISRINNNFDGNSMADKKIFNTVLKKEYDDLVETFGDKHKDVLTVSDIIAANNGNKFKEQTSPCISEQIKLSKTNEKAPLISDDLNLSSNQKILLHRVFEIINNALPKELADAVIKKISEELD